MRNPFNYFRDKKVSNVVTQVMNVMTSALSGKDLFSFMWRSRQHNTESSLRLSAVFCALNLYTGSVGSLPRSVIKLDATTGKPSRQMTTADHPAVKIFTHYANPEYSSDDLINNITNDVLMDGNYYAIRELDSQYRTFRLYYVHPSRIPRANIFYATGTEDLSINRKARKGELIYRIETGNTTEDLNPSAMLLPREMMFHIKSNLPDSQHHRGFGIVENAGRSFEMYENSEEFGVHFFKHGHKNQTFLTTEQRLSPDVLKRIEGIFEANPDAHMAEAFKTRVLEQNLKPINMAMPLAQLQFVETRAFSVEDVGRWFNVPPALLHSSMGSGKPTGDVSEMIHLFIQTGLHPLIHRIRTQVRNELLPLSSQLQYSFEFNLIYLFRTIINEFSQALRNFFEIGVMDRTEIANLLGMQIDPTDANNSLRYVPVNLMTVDHSIALRDKALLANDLMVQTIQRATLDNDNYTSPKDMLSLKQPAATEEPKDIPDDKDNSPDTPNLDKRLRVAKNSFIAVVKGLQAYEQKVLNQKKEKYNDEELTASMSEFYKDKFEDTLTNAFHEWDSVLSDVSPFSSVSTLVTAWLEPSSCLAANADSHTLFLQKIGEPCDLS